MQAFATKVGDQTLRNVLGNIQMTLHCRCRVRYEAFAFHVRCVLIFRS